MWKLNDALGAVKDAFGQALQSLPDFQNLTAFKKGDVIDKNFKSLMKDLMEQFGMVSGQDYVEDLRSNEPGADFVIC